MKHPCQNIYHERKHLIDHKRLSRYRRYMFLGDLTKEEERVHGFYFDCTENGEAWDLILASRRDDESLWRIELKTHVYMIRRLVKYMLHVIYDGLDDEAVSDIGLWEKVICVSDMPREDAQDLIDIVEIIWKEIPWNEVRDPMIDILRGFGGEIIRIK